MPQLGNCSQKPDTSSCGTQGTCGICSLSSRRVRGDSQEAQTWAPSQLGSQSLGAGLTKKDTEMLEHIQRRVMEL